MNRLPDSLPDSLTVVLKVLLLSLALALGIKYAAPLLPIAPTTVNVLIAVFLPTVILAVLLLGRFRKAT